MDYPPASFARAELATVGGVFEHVVVIGTPAALQATVGGNYGIDAYAPVDQLLSPYG